MNRFVKIRFFIVVLCLFLLAFLVIESGLIENTSGEKELNEINSAAVLSQVIEPGNDDQTIAKTKHIEGKPILLEIPSLGIELPVIDGIYNYNTKTWNLSNDASHFATMTSLANNTSGNTFIYGHNRRQVFANLPKITPGTKAQITSDNGHKFIYSYTSQMTTTPEDDTIFGYQGPSILTLQTCTGFWYQNRTLYTFAFVETQ